jgi:hypothetical protein
MEAQGLTKISGVLTAYFSAMQKLAGFNASGASGSSESAAENAATAAGLDTTQIESVGKLANLVTRLATESYQRNRLVTALTDADPAVQGITEGLDTFTKTYLDFLAEEQQTIKAEYQTVGNTKDPAMLLLLNRAYSEDLERVAERRDAANAYREALKTVREGHHTLVRDAHYLSTKDLNKALQPYTSNLNGLVPTLSKKS